MIRVLIEREFLTKSRKTHLKRGHEPTIVDYGFTS